MSRSSSKETHPGHPAMGESSPGDSPVSIITDQDLFLFNEGTHFRLYEKLGAHIHAADSASGTVFAVWAPDTEQVFVIGDFNGWDRARHPLRPRGSSGIWEAFVPGVGKGDIYKFHIVSRFIIRWSKSASSAVVAAFHFTPVLRHKYRLGVPQGGWDVKMGNSPKDARQDSYPLTRLSSKDLFRFGIPLKK